MTKPTAPNPNQITLRAPSGAPRRFRCGHDYEGLVVVNFNGPGGSQLSAYCCNLNVDNDADPNAYAPTRALGPHDSLEDAGWAKPAVNTARLAQWKTYDQANTAYNQALQNLKDKLTDLDATLSKITDGAAQQQVKDAKKSIADAATLLAGAQKLIADNGGYNWDDSKARLKNLPKAMTDVDASLNNLAKLLAAGGTAGASGSTIATAQSELKDLSGQKKLGDPEKQLDAAEKQVVQSKFFNPNWRKGPYTAKILAPLFNKTSKCWWWYGLMSLTSQQARIDQRVERWHGKPSQKKLAQPAPNGQLYASLRTITDRGQQVPVYTCPDAPRLMTQKDVSQFTLADYQDCFDKLPVIQTEFEPAPGFFVNAMPHRKNLNFPEWDERCWFANLGGWTQASFGALSNPLAKETGLAMEDKILGIRLDNAQALEFSFQDSAGDNVTVAECSFQAFKDLGGTFLNNDLSRPVNDFLVLYLAFPNKQDPIETLVKFSTATNADEFPMMLALVAQATRDVTHFKNGKAVSGGKVTANPYQMIQKWQAAKNASTAHPPGKPKPPPRADSLPVLADDLRNIVINVEMKVADPIGTLSDPTKQQAASAAFERQRAFDLLVSQLPPLPGWVSYLTGYRPPTASYPLPRDKVPWQ